MILKLKNEWHVTCSQLFSRIESILAIWYAGMSAMCVFRRLRHVD